MYTAQITKERIKLTCKNKKINMESMLLECSLGVNAIRQINDNKGIASFSLAKIADYLDCSVDYLLGRTDNPEVNRGQQHISSKNDTEFAQDITPELPTPTLADYGKIAADGGELTRAANVPQKTKTTLYDD